MTTTSQLPFDNFSIIFNETCWTSPNDTLDCLDESIEEDEGDPLGGHPYPSLYGWLHIVLTAIIVTLIMLVIVLGNVLVIVAIARDRHLNGLQNWFIASLAVSDLFVGLFVMPLTLANELMGYWVFGRVMCELWLSTDVLLCTASILNLVLISLDRYWSITKAIRYVRLRTRRMAAGMIAAVWALSMFVCLPPLVGWKRPQPKTFGYPLCVLSEEPGYVIYSTMGSFYIPLIVMILVYFKIYIAARSRARRTCQKTLSLSKSKGPKTTTSTTIHRASICKERSQLKPMSTSTTVTSLNASRRGTGFSETLHLGEGTGIRPRCITSPGDDQFCGRRRMHRSTSGGVNGLQVSAPCTPCTPYIPCSPVSPASEGCFLIMPTEGLSVGGVIGNINNYDVRGQDIGDLGQEQLKQQHQQQQETIDISPVELLNVVGIHLISQNIDQPIAENISIPVESTSMNPATFATNEITANADDAEDIEYEKPNGIGNANRTTGTGNGVVDGNINNEPEKFKRRLARARERRATFVLGIVMASFIGCWLPFFSIYPISLLVRVEIPPMIFAVIFWLGYCNSALNPIIYTIFNREFRLAFKRILFRRQTTSRF